MLKQNEVKPTKSGRILEFSTYFYLLLGIFTFHPKYRTEVQGKMWV